MRRRSGSSLGACDSEAGAVSFPNPRRTAGSSNGEIPWWRLLCIDGTRVKGEEQRRMLLAEDVPIRSERVTMAETCTDPEAPY